MEGKEIEVGTQIRKTELSFYIEKNQRCCCTEVVSFFNFSSAGFKPVWHEPIKVQSKSFKTRKARLLQHLQTRKY